MAARPFQRFQPHVKGDGGEATAGKLNRVNRWIGAEYERGWALCVDCGTRRPRATLSQSGQCLDRPWCFKARQRRQKHKSQQLLPADTPHDSEEPAG
ncbi:MAG: hypothetical protein ACT4TC_24200 [Myxococcaceae bacterium]